MQEAIHQDAGAEVEMGETASSQAAGADGGEAAEASWQTSGYFPVRKSPEVVWLEQISKHGAFIEGRMMEQSFMGHEVMRQIMICLEAFSPPPRGDWGWMLRKCTDIGVRALRQLVSIYHKNGEDTVRFMERAMQLVRLYYEEAFHRTLLGAEGAVRKASYCNLMVSMRSLEIDTLAGDHTAMGMFWTFSEGFVTMLALKVKRGEATSLENLPSYEGVMRSADMRVETFSLMLVRVIPESITMSNAEIRDLIEANGGHVDASEELGGTEEPSRFERIFSDEA